MCTPCNGFYVVQLGREFGIDIETLFKAVKTCHDSVMSKISPQPRVKLSRLRDIGWRHWDPIGLLGSGGIFTGKWDDQDNLSFADEYDRYLMAAAGQLRRGEPPENVMAYLIQIESEHMALGVSRSTKTRAQDVVNAILADAEI